MNDFAPANVANNPTQRVYNRPQQENGAHTGNNPNRLAPNVQRGNDRVELSNTAKLIDRLRNGNVERQDLITQIRAEIENGRYETADKIDQAIDELITDL